MGQIQSSINQLTMGAIGGVVAKGVKDEAKLKQELEEKQLKRQQELQKFDDNMIEKFAYKIGKEVPQYSQEEAMKQASKVYKDPIARKTAFSDMYDQRDEFSPDDIWEFYTEGAGLGDEYTYYKAYKKIFGVDPIHDEQVREAANINAKQLSNAKAHGKKQFQARLENAKSRKIRKQSVGGKR